MTNDTLKVAVLGAGPMGQKVLQVNDEATDCQVAAARWLPDQPPGLYRMTNIWRGYL